MIQPIKEMFLTKMIFWVITSVCVVTLSGCGVYHHNLFHDGHNESYRYISPAGRIFYPGHINNNQNYSPRYHNHQKINNSINISGVHYQDVELRQSRSFYVDHIMAGNFNALDGTINDIVVEERRVFRVPVCRSVIQSVNALNYNSFQQINCN